MTSPGPASQKLTIYFVRIDSVEPGSSSFTAEDENLQKETFEIFSKKSKKVFWMSPETILQQNQANNHTIFIIPSFEGEHFKHLEEIKARIYGTSLVKKLFIEKKTLPKSGFPIFSDSLKNVVICFTGILPNIRSDYENKIIYMNGRVSRVLDLTVTHLIAAECDSKSEKYVTACELNLPIMKLSWVEDAWTFCQRHDLLDMTSIDIISKYILPIFYNTVFTISGFSINKRNVIGSLIEINGGKVTTDMKRNECTHLIARLASGSKFEAAKKWNIHIVSLNWLKKCIQQKVRLSESKYPLEFTTNNSSTSKRSNSSKISEKSGNYSIQSVFRKQTGSSISENSSPILEDFTNVFNSNNKPMDPKLMAPKKKPRSSSNFVENENSRIENKLLMGVKSSTRNSMNSEESPSISPINNPVNISTRQKFDLKSSNDSDSIDLIFGASNHEEEDLGNLPTQEREKKFIYNRPIIRRQNTTASKFALNSSMLGTPSPTFNESQTVNYEKAILQNSSKTLGDMVSDMHQHLILKGFALKAREFKNQILSIVDQAEMFTLENPSLNS